MTEIKLGDSISFAMDRTANMLFRPFDFKRWAVLAVGAMLMMVGEGGGGGFNIPSDLFSGGGGGGGRRGGGRFDWEGAMNWLQTNLIWILAIVFLALLVFTGFYLLGRWLNSRGHFMMFENAVKNEATVSASWNAMRRLGNNLFKFRILYDLVLFNVLLGVVIIAGALAWPDVQAALARGEYEMTGWTISAIVALGVGLLGSMLMIWMVSTLVFGVAVPLMYIRDMAAWPAVKAAWREIVKPQPGAFFMYMLFRVVIGLCAGAWGMIAVFLFILLTCCTGYFVMLLPVVGNYPLGFLTLPMILYERVFALHWVSQFGPANQVGWVFMGGRAFPVELNPPPPGPPSGAGEENPQGPYFP